MAIAATAGTQLQISIASVFTNIPKVESIEGPTGSKQVIETTGLEDTAATYVTGMPDFGSITFTIMWDPANTAHQRLLTQYNTANSTDSFKIICPDSGAAEIAFSGSVNEFSWSFGKNEPMKAKVSVKLSGNATVTP